MPISEEFGGEGTSVMSKMVKKYGSDKGKKVFYATLNKQGKLHKTGTKPAIGKPSSGLKRSML